jgi:hypothetical protein
MSWRFDSASKLSILILKKLLLIRLMKERESGGKMVTTKLLMKKGRVITVHKFYLYCPC